jgi:hypothetical protein
MWMFGSNGFCSNKELAFVSYGGGMTATQTGEFYTAVHTLLHAINATAFP